MSPKTANGWQLRGEVNVQIRYEGSPPDLQIKTYLYKKSAKPIWKEDGFYQSFVQLRQELPLSQGLPLYHNYVCSVRYTSASALKMSSSDLYQSNSCGTLLLSTLNDHKYNQIKDNEWCNSPWSPQLEHTALKTAEDGTHEIECGFYRPFESYSTGFYTAIQFGQELRFLTGFNVFSSSVDGAPDAYDHGSELSVVLVEAAGAF